MKLDKEFQFVISIIVILAFIWQMYNLFGTSNPSMEELFIQGCVNEFKTESIAPRDKEDICECTHHAFFELYDSLIYEVDFNLRNETDSALLRDCILKVINN